MPELPAVEGYRRVLEHHALGRAVREVRVSDPTLLEGTSPAGLSRSLKGRVVAAPERHGRWLWLPTDDGRGPTLVFDLRRAGDLVADDESDAPDDVLVLVFDDGGVAYRTQRRLGGVTYLRPGGRVAAVTGPLGPDAVGIDRAGLAGCLEGRRGTVKSALLDQERVAGLGDELVDEILWRAGVHPRTPPTGLGHETLRVLHRELSSVVGQSIRAGHVPSLPTWLNGQRSLASPSCPRCGGELEQAKIAGRTTFWCPRDQPGAS